MHPWFFIVWDDHFIPNTILKKLISQRNIKTPFAIMSVYVYRVSVWKWQQPARPCLKPAKMDFNKKKKKKRINYAKMTQEFLDVKGFDWIHYRFQLYVLSRWWCLFGPKAQKDNWWVATPRNWLQQTKA